MRMDVQICLQTKLTGLTFLAVGRRGFSCQTPSPELIQKPFFSLCVSFSHTGVCRLQPHGKNYPSDLVQIRPQPDHSEVHREETALLPLHHHSEWMQNLPLPPVPPGLSSSSPEIHFFCNVQKYRATPRFFFIFCFLWARLSLNVFLIKPWAVVQAFWRVMLNFSWGHWLLFHSFQALSLYLTFSACLLCYTTPIYEWFKPHSTQLNRTSRSTHERKLGKEPILNCIFKHFVIRSLSETLLFGFL